MPRFFSAAYWVILPLLLALVMLGGCSSGLKVRDYGGFDAAKDRDAVYVIPFDATLVPPDIGDPVFNEFIDYLNSRRKQTRVARFVILKEELKEVEPAWLTKQTYISGDIWGYVENSGCCSTEIKAKSRIYLYEPGKTLPTLEVFIPVEDFFNHEKATVSASRAAMRKRLAHDLADVIIKKLTP